MEVIKIGDIFYAEKYVYNTHEKLEIDITDFYLGGGVKYTTDKMNMLFNYLKDNSWEISDTLHVDVRGVHDFTLVAIKKK